MNKNAEMRFYLWLFLSYMINYKHGQVKSSKCCRSRDCR